MRDTNQQLSGETKQKIADDLRNYVQHAAGGSANKASKMLKNVSNAYVSQILNGKWDMISDDAWRNIQKQVSNLNPDWVSVDTTANKALLRLFEDAKEFSNVFGIIAEAGAGKSHTCAQFSVKENVFLVSCSEFYNRKSFLTDLLRVMGKDSGGYTVGEMMAHVINQIRKLEKPIIILDEADKLSDQVLYFFISLYNMLEDQCGIILLATDFLEKRVERGLRLNKKGYKEIYSRLGRKFIQIRQPNRADMTRVIQANGIADPLVIARIINESEGDLRRVKRLVHASKRKGEGNDT